MFLVTSLAAAAAAFGTGAPARRAAPGSDTGCQMLSVFEQRCPHIEEMTATAKRIARRGFGILATDESVVTAGKRLETVGVKNTAENRRTFRELLYTTPGLGQYISGAILFDETLYQSTADGRRFTDVLTEQGIVIGVKVDTGLQVLAGTDGETATMGLDGLGERCRKYYDEGARFAKWRAVLRIGRGMPSERALTENAMSLARYASICQENGLVPIVEPEARAPLPAHPGRGAAPRTAHRWLPAPRRSHLFVGP